MDTRREAVTGTLGCLFAALGAVTGLLWWSPYGIRALAGSFEDTREWKVLLLGLPVSVVAGVAAALCVFAAVRGRWRHALIAAATLAAVTACGWAFDAWEGAPPVCGPGC
ncbi:hypothetical protein [uncultured Streptomyces sp.]|uniref:hypothetical protein n=1 Tax=uncultured Streptomyces sp. TaxID=174707 RepID=UPI00261E7533|nr:hypothetical protein [uncultured Streptomyces sp.]